MALFEFVGAMKEPMLTECAKAVEEYRRRRILESANAVYAALKADPAAWQALQDERSEWDATLGDGLEGDEWPLDEARS
jgi:hypothetical protein